jgi:hypothetical protein
MGPLTDWFVMFFFRLEKVGWVEMKASWIEAEVQC